MKVKDVKHVPVARLIECECGAVVPVEKYDRHRLEAVKGRLAGELRGIADGLGNVDRLMRFRARYARHRPATRRRRREPPVSHLRCLLLRRGVHGSLDRYHGRVRLAGEDDVTCNCPESGTSGSCPFHDASTRFTVEPQPGRWDTRLGRIVTELEDAAYERGRAEATAAAEQRLAALEGALRDIVERMANFDYDGVEPPHPGVVASWRDTLRLALFAPHDATATPGERTVNDLDLLETAWGIIANAGGGDWTKETSEWQQAAAKWRESYHERLDRRTPAEKAEPGWIDNNAPVEADATATPGEET